MRAYSVCSHTLTHNYHMPAGIRICLGIGMRCRHHDCIAQSCHPARIQFHTHIYIYTYKHIHIAAHTIRSPHVMCSTTHMSVDFFVIGIAHNTHCIMRTCACTVPCSSLSLGALAVFECACQFLAAGAACGLRVDSDVDGASMFDGPGNCFISVIAPL